MAALDFPDAPTVGQVFDKWTWNGTAWLLTPVTISGAGVWTSFTLVWSSAISAPTIGNASPVRARYRLDGDVVEVYYHMTFGTTTNGGTGALAFDLPFQAHAEHQEQYLHAKLFVPSANMNFHGYGHIGLSNTHVFPHFPRTDTHNGMDPWRSADVSGAPGTGIPLITGAYSMQSTGNLTVQGRYRKAP